MAAFLVSARRLLAAAIPGTLLIGPLIGQPAAAQAGSAADPSCAWSTAASVQDMNALFPESHAAYWAMSFVVHADLRISLTSTFPSSRFASVTVYKQEGGGFQVNGVDSTLTDYEITPDPGMVNPWRPRNQAPSPAHAPAGGSFAIDIVNDPRPDAVNTLPLAPAETPDGTQGWLVYRIYLPAGGDFDNVVLPQVTLDRAGTSTTLPSCAADDVATEKQVAAQPSSTPTGIGFTRPVPDLGILPNTDSGYVAATVTPPGDDQVLVVRGRAATSAHGDHPSAWPQHDRQLRYWSLCTNLDNVQRSLVVNYLSDGSTDYGCRNDDETTLDAAGYYTYVVGTEAQRSAIEQIPGATFVPWSDARPTAQHVIMLRNMLANRGFAQAIQNVPEDNDPASAQATMGDYYPRDAICALSTLETAGATACLATP